MIRIFQNPEQSAFLSRGNFVDRTLIDECIAYVIPLLEEKPEIVVFGKKCRQNRNVGFFSDQSIGYKYSNNLMKSKPLQEKLSLLLGIINNTLGTEFNGILVNEYKNGEDYISAHSDDELGLTDIGVVSISYGAERTFRIRDKKTKQIVHDEPTTQYSILQMGGNFQQLYTHEIPIQKKIKAGRVSFTFRKHNK
jgi:alkylated DNA repair dioxygenase AlkB